MREHISTGAFARLCGTTKHTLIHYDRMGVLTPALVGVNGYRYYAPPQIEVFHVIEALRELDMPLADIRAYLDRRSPEEFAELMERQAALIDQKMARLRAMRRVAAGKAELTRRAMEARVGEVWLAHTPDILLVRTPVVPVAGEWNIAVPLARHVRFCQEHGVVSPHAVGSMVEQRAALAGDAAGYTHYYTQVDKPIKGMEADLRPEGEYLSLCYAGAWEGLAGAYRQVAERAERLGLTMEGPFYEDVLLDEMSVKGYDNYMLRISIRVTPRPKIDPSSSQIL